MSNEQVVPNTRLTLDTITDQDMATILGIYESMGLPVNYGTIPPVRMLKEEMRGKYNGVELVPKPGVFLNDKLTFERIESFEGKKYFHVSVKCGGLMTRVLGLDYMTRKFDAEMREQFLYH